MIGKYALIGAGTVVTKDVPDYCLVIGNPAKIKRYVCMCGCNLDDNLQCIECGKKYMKVNDRIIMK